MSKEKVELFLEEMSYKTDYSFLEFGKDDEELKTIAEKFKINLPSKDIAIFKGKYAFVDKQNLNGCTLPKEEVIKSLKTLTGKAVDKDHLRKSTIGFWLNSGLDNTTIISYGAFWKSNFPEDYEEIKKRMSEGKLKISFEAWGEREVNEKGGYNLTDIEFAGGALLFDTKPAFEGAEVLEFAKLLTEEEKSKLFTGIQNNNDNNMDELAKIEQIEGAIPPEVIAKIKELIKKGVSFKDAAKQAWAEYKKSQGTEEAQLQFMYDDNLISRICSEETCPFCNEKSYKDVTAVDFANSQFTYKCGYCGSTCQVDLTPKTEIKKKGKKPLKYKMVPMKGSIDIENFSGSDEELDTLLISQLEGEDLVDEDLDILEDAKKLSYKDRQNIKDDLFAVVKDVKNKITGKPRKIRMFPIADPAHVRNALARLPQATETLKKLGISPESVKTKILKRARELKMTDLLKRHVKGGLLEVEELLRKYNKADVGELIKMIDDAISSVNSKEQELATLKTSLEDAKKASETAINEAKQKTEKAEADAKTAKEALDAKLATERASLIKARREELTEEYAKDLKDEDILDDTKFELAKTKKELALVKAGKLAQGGLEAGAAGIKEIDKAFETQNKIQAEAWKE